ELVLGLDHHHRQAPALGGERVAGARVRLLLREQRVALALPLLLAHDRRQRGPGVRAERLGGVHGEPPGRARGSAPACYPQAASRHTTPDRCSELETATRDRVAVQDVRQRTLSIARTFSGVDPAGIE